MAHWLWLVLILLLPLVAAAKPAVVAFGNESVSTEMLISMIGLEQMPSMGADEIRGRLQTTGLFSDVEVYRTKGAMFRDQDGNWQDDIITIYLHEKATWFAVPYLSRDAAASTYGLAFGKATIYGRDARLLGRYQVGTAGREASLLLKDSALLNTRWQLGGSFDHENALHRVFGGPSGREVVHRTRNEYVGGSFQVGYRVHPYVSVGVNNYMEQHRFEELNGEYRAGLQWSHKLMAEYNRFYVNEGLSDGAMANAYYEVTNPVSDFEFWKAGGGAQWGAFRRGNVNWIVRGRAELGARLPRYQLFELGGGRLRGFPNQQFRDRFQATAQNDLLLASLNVWALRFRPLVFADWALVEKGGRTGVGAGFQIYVREVAIPAVQFFAGYGFHPNGFTVAAAIGPQI